MPGAPDRSHLADAIHLMDLLQLVDGEVPIARATVDRSKAALDSARMELEKHRRWLESHQELYAEALKGCEQQLKRRAFINACKQVALVPIELVASAGAGLFHTAFAHSRRDRLRAELQSRIQAMTNAAGHGSHHKPLTSRGKAKLHETPAGDR